ncbi:hypothetical protein PV797_17955 [Clostridiaceae bacterium M8S5]|nr:hypothetical protein PV797_17955 [Clostridiaceae bacterium M8S5]
MKKLSKILNVNSIQLCAPFCPCRCITANKDFKENDVSTLLWIEW